MLKISERMCRLVFSVFKTLLFIPLSSHGFFLQDSSGFLLLNALLQNCQMFRFLGKIVISLHAPFSLFILHPAAFQHFL